MMIYRYRDGDKVGKGAVRCVARFSANIYDDTGNCNNVVKDLEYVVTGGVDEHYFETQGAVYEYEDAIEKEDK